MLETGSSTPGDKKWRKSLANDFRHFLSPGVEDPVSNTESLPARLRSSMQRIIYSSRRKSEPGRKSSEEQQMLPMSAAKTDPHVSVHVESYTVNYVLR